MNPAEEEQSDHRIADDLQAITERLKGLRERLDAHQQYDHAASQARLRARREALGDESQDDADGDGEDAPPAA